MKKQLTAMMLAGVLALGAYSNVLAESEAVESEVTTEATSESETAPERTARAVTVSYSDMIIGYNNGKVLGVAGRINNISGNVSVWQESYYYVINQGVPVTLGFDLDDSHYINVYFKDIDGTVYPFYTGETKNFEITYSFSEKVTGAFYIENYTAGRISVNNAYVRF